MLEVLYKDLLLRVERLENPPPPSDGSNMMNVDEDDYSSQN
jgi:hypothetical protein